MVSILYGIHYALNLLQTFHLLSGSNGSGNKKSYDNFSSYSIALASFDQDCHLYACIPSIKLF
jgi:hypothetical protein